MFASLFQVKDSSRLLSVKPAVVTVPWYRGWDVLCLLEDSSQPAASPEREDKVVRFFQLWLHRTHLRGADAGALQDKCFICRTTLRKAVDNWIHFAHRGWKTTNIEIKSRFQSQCRTCIESRPKETSHSYSLYSSDEFQHPLRPFGVAEIPVEEGSDCDLVAVNIPRAWVTLANWKSMSDVTNMCQFTFEVYRSHGDQEREENRNRKIKFVFYYKDLSDGVNDRKIWHVGGDMTANKKVFVFRNIIM